jgi:hypothetical protein
VNRIKIKETEIVGCDCGYIFGKYKFPLNSISLKASDRLSLSDISEH